MRVKELIARLMLQDPENEVLMTDLGADVKVQELLNRVYEVYDLGEVGIEEIGEKDAGEATMIYASLIAYDMTEVVSSEDEALLSFKQTYKGIMDNESSQHERAVQLADVMTRMEHHYKIPLVGKKRMQDFEHEYPEVWNLYITVSASRA